MSEDLAIVRFSFRGRRFAAIVQDLDGPDVPANITPAERHVASFIRRGISNRDIAKKRGTSPRTVANQIASLMRKLSASSRVELILRLSHTAK